MQRMIGGELVDVIYRFPFPPGSTPINASSGVVANASAAASLAAVVGKTNYITGFQITGGGATLALLVAATLTGLAGGTLTYIYGAVAGALLNGPMVNMRFDPPLGASALNTAITITLPALGAGNTAAAVNITGYSL